MKRLAMWVLVLITLSVIVLLVFLFATSKGKNLQNKDAFIQELNKKGYKVQQTQLIPDDKRDFGVPRLFIATDKAVFDVYEFTSTDDAKRAASYISPNGSSILTPKQKSYISWSDHPHFYCSGKLIVQYVGSDTKILLDMRNIMGKQTAGAKWYEMLLSRRGK